jgi:hypothetical protein
MSAGGDGIPMHAELNNIIWTITLNLIFVQEECSNLDMKSLDQQEELDFSFSFSPSFCNDDENKIFFYVNNYWNTYYKIVK